MISLESEKKITTMNETSSTNNSSTQNNYYDEYFTKTDAGLNAEVNNIEANCITSRNNKFSLDSEGNLICNSIITSEQSQSNLNFNQIYPIGSIYMSVNDVNPSTLFEGTAWEKIVDKFLIGAGNKYSLGSMGGSETHNHTSAAHSHTSASHSHNYGSLYSAINFAGTYGTRYKTKTGISFSPNERKADGGAGYGYTTACNEGVQVFGDTGWTTPGNTGLTTPENTGNSATIPPYLAINIWKRVS